MILKDDFKKHLPEKAISILEIWLQELDLILILSKSRNSKYGDFRAGINGSKSRISVNTGLNQYSFLITLTHEIAHAYVFKYYKRNRTNPHGKEWKNEFIRLMLELLQLSIFPDDIRTALEKHLKNPKASTNADRNLFKTLNKYDLVVEDGLVFLEELPEGQLFQTQEGRVFKKAEKRRTRYLCVEIQNNKKYSVNSTLRIKPIANN